MPDMFVTNLFTNNREEWIKLNETFLSMGYEWDKRTQSWVKYND